MGIVKITDSTEMELLPQAMEDAERRVPAVVYEDLGGMKPAIAKVREMIELPLKHPELFDRLGIDQPRGVLLQGPPGTGKTMLAKAVANESDAYFISVNGPEVRSKCYGESEKALRDLFEEAEKNAPSIVFLDELDSIAPKRGEVTGEVERRVVAQLLCLMDGLKERKNVIVIGATNRPDLIDPALLRPGRFDELIMVPVPDTPSRDKILQVYLKKMPLDKDVDTEELVKLSDQYTGADIAAVARKSVRLALREDMASQVVSQRHFLAAIQETSPPVTPDVMKYYQKLAGELRKKRSLEIERERIRLTSGSSITLFPTFSE